MDIDVSTIEGVVFDLDGTLVDSRLDFDELRRRLGFPPGQPILEHLATLNDPIQAATAEKIIADYEMACAKGARWMPGAQTLLKQLRRQNVPTAILTRNIKSATQLMMETLAISVDRVLTREDCRPKPAPDGLLLIAESLGLNTSASIYIGDYVFDLEAARSANMIACLYRNQRNGAFVDKADWVIDHFDQLTQAFIERRQGIDQTTTNPVP